MGIPMHKKMVFIWKKAPQCVAWWLFYLYNGTTYASKDSLYIERRPCIVLCCVEVACSACKTAGAPFTNMDQF